MDRRAKGANLSEATRAGMTRIVRKRAHYDIDHYIPEKRDALTRWVQRLTEILGHEPNEVMKADRTRYQGKGPARRLGSRETYRERKARLAEDRDLAAERRRPRPEAAQADWPPPPDPSWRGAVCQVP